MHATAKSDKVRYLSMFDWYEPDPPIKCISCDAIPAEWQGREGPNALLVWRQGHRHPIRQRADDEALAGAELLAFVLPEQFHFYTTCENGHQLLFGGRTTGGVWTDCVWCLTSWTDDELRRRIESIGVEELGRRYALRTIEQLNAMSAAEDARSVEVAHDDDEWIDSAGFGGDQLTDEEYFEMILAALDAARDHHGALWCIGDGPMDHLVGRDRSYALRFHQARPDSGSIAAAFDAMHDDLDSCGLEHGWWADDYPDRGFR